MSAPNLSRQLAELQLPSIFTDASINDLVGDLFFDFVSHLCNKYDPDLFNRLQGDINSRTSESQRKSIADFVSVLGLQFPDKPSAREEFIRELVTLTILKHTTPSETLDAKLKSCSTLIHHIAEDQKNMFASTQDLIPAEMRPVIRKYTQQSQSGATQLQHFIAQIDDLVKGASTTLETLQSTLRNLQQQTPNFAADRDVAHTHSSEAVSTLRAAISEKVNKLHLLLQSFSDTYHQEWLPWARNSNSAPITGIGKQAHNLLRILTPLEQLMSEFENARINYSSLLNQTGGLHSVDFEAAVLRAREMISCLKQAVQRLDETSQ